VDFPPVHFFGHGSHACRLGHCGKTAVVCLDLVDDRQFKSQRVISLTALRARIYCTFLKRSQKV
jgi:predicted protein tyrosine phosphatase